MIDPVSLSRLSTYINQYARSFRACPTVSCPACLSSLLLVTSLQFILHWLILVNAWTEVWLWVWMVLAHEGRFWSVLIYWLFVPEPRLPRPHFHIHNIGRWTYLCLFMCGGQWSGTFSQSIFQTLQKLPVPPLGAQVSVDVDPCSECDWAIYICGNLNANGFQTANTQSITINKHAAAELNKFKLTSSMKLKSTLPTNLST